MPRNWHKEVLANKVVEALKKNNFEASYVSTKEEAQKLILELAQDSANIGIGGSNTIGQLGVIAELKKMGKEIYDHGAPGLSPEEKLGMRRKQQTCDCFLSSTNAVTLDGKLVNVDGTGNRVSAMIFGPQKVVVAAGFNKIVKDVDAAMTRIELEAAPLNNKRLNLPNPCAKTGICMDCALPSRICNVTAIIRKKPSASDFHVIIVGEELGF
ncbi:MAG: lactate utilization protein [Clostridia bacterium]|jgi:hypothetical protein|nr:lactate utilization protein [Clostridia bacterium]